MIRPPVDVWEVVAWLVDMLGVVVVAVLLGVLFTLLYLGGF